MEYSEGDRSETGGRGKGGSVLCKKKKSKKNGHRKERVLEKDEKNSNILQTPAPSPPFKKRRKDANTKNIKYGKRIRYPRDEYIHVYIYIYNKGRHNRFFSPT